MFLAAEHPTSSTSAWYPNSTTNNSLWSHFPQFSVSVRLAIAISSILRPPDNVYVVIRSTLRNDGLGSCLLSMFIPSLTSLLCSHLPGFLPFGLCMKSLYASTPLFLYPSWRFLLTLFILRHFHFQVAGPKVDRSPLHIHMQLIRPLLLLFVSLVSFRGVYFQVLLGPRFFFFCFSRLFSFVQVLALTVDAQLFLLLKVSPKFRRHPV